MHCRPFWKAWNFSLECDIVNGNEWMKVWVIHIYVYQWWMITILLYKTHVCVNLLWNPCIHKTFNHYQHFIMFYYYNFNWYKHGYNVSIYINTSYMYNTISHITSIRKICRLFPLDCVYFEEFTIILFWQPTLNYIIVLHKSGRKPCIYLLCL